MERKLIKFKIESNARLSSMLREPVSLLFVRLGNASRVNTALGGDSARRRCGLLELLHSVPPGLVALQAHWRHNISSRPGASQTRKLCLCLESSHFSPGACTNASKLISRFELRIARDCRGEQHSAKHWPRTTTPIPRVDRARSQRHLETKHTEVMRRASSKQTQAGN